MKYNRGAFSLIELLVVVFIIGLIASSALVFVKDTAEVKALTYTKKVMHSIKNGIAHTDEDGYFTGFVNDFGTLPPHADFLLAKDGDTFNYVDGELKKFRFTNMLNRGTQKFSAPFMDDNLTEIKPKVLYAGFHGGYMKTDDNGNIVDGWGEKITLVVEDMNKSNQDFLLLASNGSDKTSNIAPINIVRSEFDLTKDDGSVEKIYADDYNLSFSNSDFIVNSLEIDFTLPQDHNDSTAVAVIVYSPMLYYVKNSQDEICIDNNQTHATCNAVAKEYKPYIPFDTNISTLADQNLSWQVGLIKYAMYFNDNNNTSLVVNKKGLSNGTKALTDYTFFDSFDVKYIDNTGAILSKPWLFSPTSIDDNFYMYAGKKMISAYAYDNTIPDWVQIESFTMDFKPNRTQKIKIGSR